MQLIDKIREEWEARTLEECWERFPREVQNCFEERAIVETLLEKEWGSKPLESVGELRTQLAKTHLHSSLLTFIKDPRNREAAEEKLDAKSTVENGFRGWLERKIKQG